MDRVISFFLIQEKWLEDNPAKSPNNIMSRKWPRDCRAVQTNALDWSDLLSNGPLAYLILN